MNLTKILAISGKPGLYHLETQTRTGFLATSLADDKHISVEIRNNVSLLCAEIGRASCRERV